MMTLRLIFTLMSIVSFLALTGCPSPSTKPEDTKVDGVSANEKLSSLNSGAAAPK